MKNLKKINNEKILVGRKDKVDFPKLGLFDIDAKIDTGAHTSAIHCRNIKLVKGLKSGQKKVRFNLLDPSHSKYNDKLFRIPLHAKRKIKNSFGQTEQRYIVKTTAVIFNKEFEVELSLADRSKMECPVLIGISLLKKGFIVDVNKYNLSYKNKGSNK